MASNPVVFFDIAIGGQHAGRIEMTVRVTAASFYIRIWADL